MSYTIEYARKVFKVPAGTMIPAGFGYTEHLAHEDEYYVFIKSGCNNLDPRPQEWQLAVHGWNYKVIGTICERAGWTEGGGLKFTSRDTRPENYLKMYRKEIASAAEFSLEAIESSIGVFGGYICLGNKHSTENEWINKKVSEMKDWSNASKYHDYLRYDFNFSSEAHFRAFIHFQSLIDTMGGYHGIHSFQNKP